MTRVWITTALLLCATTIGCGRLLSGTEGANAGECADALDNDGDELYDCDDPDCAASPDCQPDTTGNGDYYDYEQFADDMLQASCDKLDECDFYTEYFTYEDCLALGDPGDTGHQSWDCEDYDDDAARQCVEDWQNISCDDFIEGHGLESCSDVCSND